MPSPSRWLMLEVRYLLGRYHGKEWPPAPMRLLQAGLAVLRDPAHPVLLWLENQPPPVIDAEAAPPCSAPLPMWVDENSPNTGWPRSKTMRRVQTRFITQPLRYLYPLAENVSGLSGWCAALAQISCLGTGQDSVIVRAEVITALPAVPEGGQRFLPWAAQGSLRPAGARLLRIPQPGSLADCAAIYQDWRDWQKSLRPGRREPLFGQQIYAPDQPGRNQLCLPLLLQHPDGSGFRAFPHTDGVVVAGMVRGALLRQCETLFGAGHSLAAFVARHVQDDPDAQPAYLPLPTVGSPHADGALRRLLLVVPLACRIDMQQLEDLLDAPLPVFGLQHDAPAALLCRADAGDSMFARYQASARCWTTVTPLVLPGDYAPDDKTVLKLVRKALREAGIAADNPERIEISRYPWHPQARPALDYRRGNKHGKRAYCWHVRVWFRREVMGPLCIGRQRHAGLGLMLPVSDGWQKSANLK